MSEDNILSLIGKDAVEQFNDAIERVDELGAKIKATNDMINNMPKPEKGGSSNAELKNQVDLQKQVVTMQKQISDLEAKLANAYKNTSTEAKAASNNEKKLAAGRRARSKSEAQQAVEHYKIKDRQAKATLRVIKQTERLEKQMEREANAVAKLQNPYEQMKALYRDSADHAKALGAELWQLMQTEGASEEQIKKLTKEYREANKSALELHVGLSDIERATGQSQRNVGNYNGLLVETNHILREIPNFAMSARTGILSLSNNMPMFADQFSKVAKEIDETTGKAKGLGGAFTQLGRAVFSWHTLLIVGITLAVQYADEIGQFFKNLSQGRLFLSTAQKAQIEYNKAMEEGIETLSKSIAQITALRHVLNDTTTTQEKQRQTLKQLADEFPEYLGNLNLQSYTLEEINNLLDNQILLLRKKAREEAAQSALSVKQADVEKNIQKAIGQIRSGNLQSAAKSFSKAQKGQEELIESTEYLMSQEKEYRTFLQESIEDAKEGIKSQIDYKNVLIERTKTASTESSLYNTEQIKVIDRKIEQMRVFISYLEDELDLHNEIYKVTRPTDSYDDAENIYKITELEGKLEGNAEKEREGRNRRIAINTAKALQDLYDNTVSYYTALSQQTGESLDELLAKDVSYQNAKRAIQLQAQVDMLDDDKRAGRARKASLDREIKGLLEYSKVMNALSSSMGEANLYHLDKIASDEENALSKRLDAIEQGAENRRRIINASLSDEINANEERIKLAEEALKKIESLRTDEEKSAIIDLDLMYTERERLTINHNTEMERLTDETEKKKLDTIKQYQDMLIREARETADELFRQSKISLNKQLIELNKAYMSGNMSYKGYLRLRRKTTYEHGEEERKQVVDLYNKMMADSLMQLAMHGLTTEEKGAIRGRMEEINRWMEEQLAGLAPRKERSWMDMIFGDKVSDDPNDPDAMEARKQAIIDAVRGFYEDIFNAIDAIRERRYRDQLDVLDKESERIKENAQIEKDAVESSLLSQEEKAKRMEEIATRQEAFQAGIDEKRRRIENEKARADKRAALFRIALDGAMAVSKAIAQFGLKGLVIAGILAASVAAQMAVVSAQSVPVYGDGTDNHVGGLAVVGDRGTELVNTPQGKSFLTPNRSTLMDLPKGTKVIPNHELDLAHHKAMGHDIVHKYEMGDSNGMEALYMMFGDKVDELAEAIVNKKETHFHWDNGELRKSIKKGNNWTRYVNKII